jgi:hypothetical protein
MTRYTSAYSSFLLRLKEVDTLLVLAKNLERKNPIVSGTEINALCRGAIVLLSSHVESYIKELGEVTLESIHSKKVPRTNISLQFYYHISKQSIQDIKNTEDYEKIAEKFFQFIQDDLHYWERQGPFPNPLPSEKFNSGFSNPAFKKIKSYLSRFGYDSFKNDLASKLTTKLQATINTVNHLVELRNQIAHGDQYTSKTPSDIKQLLIIIKLFCETTDNIFASWCTQHLCSIR